MTQLRLENLVENIRLAREFSAMGYMSEEAKLKIEHDLGKYIVCTPPRS